MTDTAAPAIETWQQALPHGITLSCRAAGERGRPVLMFLHGFPEAAFVWDALLQHFARPENGGFRCVAPNLRGFERSSEPAEVRDYRPKFLVQDIEALIDLEAASQGGRLAALVAHDWGGAVAWNVANQSPQRMQRLVIINSPHPGTFWRELRSNTRQQQASAYMNFFTRPDAAAYMAADDFRRLFAMFQGMGAMDGPFAWMTPQVMQQYREVWSLGLDGGLNYYRASPLRPPRPEDPAAAGIELPREMLVIRVPTLVVWGLQDHALMPELIEGLDGYIPDLRIERIPEASH